MTAIRLPIVIALGLIVRHVNGGGPEPSLELRELRAHLDAELGVEVGERLVEEEHRRLANDRATHRHSLALPARELPRLAVE